MKLNLGLERSIMKDKKLSLSQRKKSSVKCAVCVCFTSKEREYSYLFYGLYLFVYLQSTINLKKKYAPPKPFLPLDLEN
jgi:hypothetical protein